MSFSRPDPSSPTSIADASFGTSRRGFDQAEVRDFLRMVAAEFGRLRERERFLERELQSAQSETSHAPIDEAMMTQMLGEEAVRVLTTARESAHEIRDKAEKAAAQLLQEAGDEAARVREEADIEASRRRADAAADAESELAMAKQQGREMVNEARAYRERVLSELARRREVAREQIEQLIHGRDRLMQSFERARLVAVDVVAEMQPLGEPDEYVNLAPTTGPLPVMIANSPRPSDAAEALAAPPVETLASEAGATADVADAAHAADAAAAAGSESEMPSESPAALRIIEIDDDGRVDTDAVDAVHVESSDVHDEADEAEAVAPEAAEAADADEIVADAADAEEADATELTADDLTAEESAGDVEVAESQIESAAADTDEAVDEEAEAADQASSAEDTADDDTDADDDRGDVVVDLFARLRADTVEVEKPDVDADNAVWPAEVLAAANEQRGVEQRTPEAAADGATAVDAVEAADGDADGAADADADAEQTLFEQRDEVITPLIVSSAKKLKRALADEQNDVLDALRRIDAVADIDAVLPPASEHAARYKAAIADDLLEAVHGGSATSRTGTRNIRKALSSEAVAVADDALTQWLVMPLRERLGRCITDGEGDNAVITKKVRAVYREWKTQHIDETLDDVMRCAHGRGVLAGFDAGTPIVWEVDTRFSACPDCDDNALAGAVAAGDEFPTGDVFAPAHHGCRCLLVAADR